MFSLHALIHPAYRDWCAAVLIVLLCATLRQVASRPNDIEALRLLGESRLLNAEPAKSVAAYEQAIALAPSDQSLITVSEQDGIMGMVRIHA